MKHLKIAIGADHAGYQLKEKLKSYLDKKGYVVKDFGTYSDERVDYPDFAHPLAQAVEDKQFDFGVLMCGSGNGINISANRHPGVRAALCWNKEIAELARQHNDANIISLPARFIDEKEAENCIDAFFETAFEGGRHKDRIDKINITC